MRLVLYALIDCTLKVLLAGLIIESIRKIQDIYVLLSFRILCSQLTTLNEDTYIQTPLKSEKNHSEWNRPRLSGA